MMPDNINDTAKLLAELEAAKIQRMEFIAPLDAASAALEVEIIKIKAAAEAALSALIRDKSKLANEKHEAERDSRRLSSEIESAQAHLRVMKAAEASKEANLVLEQRWDSMTIGAPWREWAKDHQISGAKQIAYSHKMILADTMGTGKTLTATIALDLIHADTTDRSSVLTEARGYYWTMQDGTKIPSATSAGPIPAGVDATIHASGYADYGTYSYDKPVKESGRHILWFAPASVMAGAEREILKWAGKDREVVIIGGVTKMERHLTLEMLIKNQEILDNYIVIVNYEAGRRDKRTVQLLATPGLFDTIVIDEAHNIKNIKTSAYKDVQAIVNGSEAEYVIPMTGTPILNRPQELFALLSLVDSKNFYSVNNFLHRYCQQQWVGNSLKWVFQPGGAEMLLKKMRHLYLRRTKKECGFMLDEPQTITYSLDLTSDGYEEQLRVYREMRDLARIQLDPERKIEASNTLSLYTRLRQLVTMPTGVRIVDSEGALIEAVTCEQSIKLDTCLVEGDENEDPSGIIPEILSESKVVVFSQFNEPLNVLVRRCEASGITAAVYNGDLSYQERDSLIKRFRDLPVGAPNGVDVICMNHRAGGVGVDGLQMQSNHMIIIDREWNPGKEDQSIGRLDRMGQEKQVTIHQLVVKDSIDQWMSGLIDSKRDMIDGFNEKASSLSQDLFDAINTGLV